MKVVIDLLRAQEQWLMERILQYAREQGYTEFTSMTPESWRVSVASLTTALAEALENTSPNLESDAAEDRQRDPASAFGALEARRHNERGIVPAMFLGLFVYYRQAYRECIRQFLPAGDERSHRERAVLRMFDRMQAAYLVEWSRADETSLMNAMSANLRQVTCEKNRYLTFFESLSVPVIFFDVQGDIVTMNSAACDLAHTKTVREQSPQAMLIEGGVERLSGRHLGSVFPWLEASMQGVIGNPEQSVVEKITLGDRHFRVVGSRQPCPVGKQEEFFLLLFDESDTCRARAQAGLAKEELERTLDTLTDLVFMTDSEGVILRANQPLADRLGLPIADLIGRKCDDVLGESDCLCGEDQVCTAATPVSYRNMTGHFLVSRNVVHDATGSVCGFVSVCRDVSEMEKIMQTLASVEGKYQGLFENAHDGMFQSLLEGSLLKVNPALASMFGFTSPAQMLDECQDVGGSLYEHPEDREAIVREGLESGFIAPRELRLRRRDGTSFWGIVGGRMVRDAEGNVRHLEGFVQDQTERKMLEAQLMQTQKLEAIGQLAAGIAHEINTPTQYVLNNMWFIKEGVEQLGEAFAAHYGLLVQMLGIPNLEDEVFRLRDLDEKLQVQFYLQELPAAITETLQGLDRISAIVRSVKQFAHPGHDNMQSVDLNELIENTVTLSRNEWKYVADITTDLDATLPKVFCLMQEIGQVLLNLIINAAHAIMESGLTEDNKGEIHIMTRVADGMAEIRIKDSGTGIPEAARQHIFEPFFTTKPVGKGTGQGLFMAHRTVVKNHGGSIDFETEIGMGTTFIIRLPFSGGESEVFHG